MVPLSVPLTDQTFMSFCSISISEIPPKKTKLAHLLFRCMKLLLSIPFPLIRPILRRYLSPCILSSMKSNHCGLTLYFD